MGQATETRPLAGLTQPPVRSMPPELSVATRKHNQNGGRDKRYTQISSFLEKAVASRWVSQKQSPTGALVLETYQGNTFRSEEKQAE